MEYLKKHNEEDFEIMSEEDYSNYEEALCDLTRQLGLECYTLNEMEEELLSIIEYIRRPKRISGSKFDSASKAKKNSVYNSYKPIEKSYIGDGELRFLKSVRTVGGFDEKITFNVIRMQTFSDIFEDDVEQALSCEMYDDFDGEYVKLANLPLSTLLEIIELIKKGKATLYSRKDCILDYRGVENLKKVMQASGLLEDGVL